MSIEQYLIGWFFTFCIVMILSLIVSPHPPKDVSPGELIRSGMVVATFLAFLWPLVVVTMATALFIGIFIVAGLIAIACIETWFVD